MRSGGRVVEGARLESEYTPKAYRGFESLPLRQAPVPTGSQQSTGLDNIGRNQRIFPPARSYRFVTLRRSWGMGIGSQKWGIRRHVERRQNPRRQARAKAYKLADAHSSISMCRPGLEALSHEAGAIDKSILREFDEECLAPATRSSPMRSKPYGRYRTSPSRGSPATDGKKNLVSDWERSTKKHGGLTRGVESTSEPDRKRAVKRKGGSNQVDI